MVKPSQAARPCQANQKEIEVHPKRWHEVLLVALWAHHISDERIKALGEIEIDKFRVARAYNKRVKENSF
jgi:hypothetical protein